MPLETSELNQKALLWVANGTNDQGEPKVDAKVEINVRWEEGRAQGVDDSGTPIAIDATVVVDRVIVVKSIMWLGSEEDLTTNPPTSDLMQVLGNGKVPDIKGRNFRRTVTLKKFSDTLPDLA